MKIYAESCINAAQLILLEFSKALLDKDDESLRPTRSSWDTFDDEDKCLLYDTDDSTQMILNKKERVL